MLPSNVIKKMSRSWELKRGIAMPSFKPLCRICDNSARPSSWLYPPVPQINSRNTQSFHLGFGPARALLSQQNEATAPTHKPLQRFKNRTFALRPRAVFDETKPF